MNIAFYIKYKLKRKVICLLLKITYILTVSSTVTLKELQEVESTVLYYIYQSALDNSKGTMEYLKCLKSVANAPEYILDSFVMSVLLLLSGLYEDQTFQILKQALLRQIQDEENKNNSAWLRRVSRDDSSAMEIIYQVIDNSNTDRQLVLKGMVDFAFVLLSVERKAGVEQHLPWDYGCKILQKIARKRHDAGGTILENLVDKIVRGGTQVIQYTGAANSFRPLISKIMKPNIFLFRLPGVYVPPPDDDGDRAAGLDHDAPRAAARDPGHRCGPRSTGHFTPDTRLRIHTRPADHDPA